MPKPVIVDPFLRATQINLALGGHEFYAEFLDCLPNDYFRLSPSAQDAALAKVQKAIHAGERNPEVLARVVSEHMSVPQEVTQ